MFILGLLILNTIAAPPKVASWKSIPDVLICKDSEVTLKDARSAVTFWENRGFEFGTITYERSCDNYHEGHIMFIGDSNLEKGYLGMTEIFEHGGIHKTITSAYIEISDDQSKNLILLAHEIGHAIGYKHDHDSENVMYSDVKQVNIKIRR